MFEIFGIDIYEKSITSQIGGARSLLLKKSLRIR